MAEPIGRKRWAIAEGYIPAWGHGPEPQMSSHETCCILNAGDVDAHVEITIMFEDRDPAIMAATHLLATIVSLVLRVQQSGGGL